MRRRRPERADLYKAARYRGLARRLAGNVRRLRVGSGWTQEEAAEQMAMPVRLLQGIEAGSMNVTLVTLARLCDGFDVEPAVLFEPLPAKEPGKSRK